MPSARARRVTELLSLDIPGKAEPLDDQWGQHSPGRHLRLGKSAELGRGRGDYSYGDVGRICGG